MLSSEFYKDLRYKAEVNVVEKYGANLSLPPLIVIEIIKERDRLVKHLEEARACFGTHTTHGEDCAFAATEEDDEVEECDCGAEEYFKALFDCEKIDVKQSL